MEFGPEGLQQGLKRFKLLQDDESAHILGRLPRTYENAIELLVLHF